MTIQIKQSSTTYPLVFLMVDSTDHITAKTGLSPTVTLSKAGASFGAAAGAVSEIGSGWYKVAGNATDNATLGPLILHATASGADPTDVVFNVSARLVDDVMPTYTQPTGFLAATFPATVASTTNITAATGVVLSGVTHTGAVIPTVTTVTNQLTAAQVATGVWQDTTAGDFTVASSIGKSLYTGNVVPGGSGGLFIAGSNAATTVNFTGNLSGSVGSVTGLTASNLDATISSRMATYTQPTGFLAATFPGTVASTTNITAGTITTTTNLTNLPSIPSNWLTAAGIDAGALNGKGDWNIGKTGYSLTQTFPSNFSALSITAGGLVDITQAAADKAWGTAARVLTAGTNIVLAKGVGVTGFNDLSAAAVNAEVDTAIADAALASQASVDTIDGIVDAILLDTAEIGAAGAGLTALASAANLATVDSNVDAIKVTTDKLDDTLELTSDGYVFTALSLEQAPTGGSAPTAADIADAVWEEAIADHSGTTGSTAESLNAAGAGGDPWIAALPGSYSSGQAGYILGTNLDAVVSTLATQSSVDDLPTNAELATALGTADDAVLAILGTPAGASLSADVAAVKSQTAAIETDTQDIQGRLPAALVSGRIDASVGAMAANTMTAAAAAADLTTELQTGLATASVLAAVKAKTDNLPASPAATGDIPTATQNADALLNRDMSAVSDSNSRTPLNALRFLRNKWAVAGATLTVNKEDDSTEAWTAEVTTSAGADPVTGSDPA